MLFQVQKYHISINHATFRCYNFRHIFADRILQRFYNQQFSKNLIVTFHIIFFWEYLQHCQNLSKLAYETIYLTKRFIMKNLILVIALCTFALYPIGGHAQTNGHDGPCEHRTPVHSR